jgi:hypothetical protein
MMKGHLLKRLRRKKMRISEAPSQTDKLVAQISYYLKRRDAGYWPPARRAYASERL